MEDVESTNASYPPVNDPRERTIGTVAFFGTIGIDLPSIKDVWV